MKKLWIVLISFCIIIILLLCYRWLRSDRKFISLQSTENILVNNITTGTDDIITGELLITTGIIVSSWVEEILPQDIKYFKDFPGLVKRKISYVNTNPQRPIYNNVSDIFLSFTGIWATEMSAGVMNEWNIEFIVNEIYALDTQEIIVHGVVTNDTEIVEMIRNKDQKIHTIDWFTPGKKDFSFIISTKNNNLSPWINSYLVRAYAKNKVYYSLIKVTFFVSQQSYFGEKIISTPPRKDYGRTLPSITKSLACQTGNWLHEYNLETKRPWKNTLVWWFYKNKNILYYAVMASTSAHPMCEDSDFELALFTYDCSTQKSQELATYGRVMDERDGICYLDIIGGTGNMVAFSTLYYEGNPVTWILNTVTKQKENIIPFGYVNSAQIKENVQSIQDKYSLTSDGMEFVTFADNFSFNDCDDNLICDLVYNRYINETHELIFDTKIDLINKIIK